MSNRVLSKYETTYLRKRVVYPGMHVVNIGTIEEERQAVVNLSKCCEIYTSASTTSRAAVMYFVIFRRREAGLHRLG